MEAIATTCKLGPPKHVRFSERGNSRIEKLSRMFTSLFPAVCSNCGKRFEVYCEECDHRAIRNTDGEYECMECDTVSSEARCPITCDICGGQIREKEVSDSEQIRHSVNFLYTIMLAGYSLKDILMEITVLCRESLQQPLKTVLNGSDPESETVYMVLYETAKEIDDLQSMHLGDLMTRLYDKAKETETKGEQ